MIYRFTNCLLDGQLRELRAGGATVHLEPQVLDVLLHLVENRDRVVSRDELIDAVWQGRNVSDATVGARIFAARHAVGDSGTAQAVIRTLPRRGFRFVAPVAVEPGSMPGAVSADPTEIRPAGQSLDRPSPRQRPRLRRAMAVAAGVVLLLVGAGVTGSLLFRTPRLESVSPERMAFPLPEEPSVAVLPFASIGGDAAQNLMAEGLAEGLVNALAGSPALFVIARSSTTGYIGQPGAAARAAEDLGVRYIVEGSITHEGGQVRVAARLVDAVSARVLWAERYERAAEDLLTLEDTISAGIARSLDVRIEKGTARSAGGTRNVAASNAFLLGRSEYLSFTADGNLRARDHYLRALEADPDYAEAMVALANTHLIEMMYSPPAEWGGALAEIAGLDRRAAAIAPGMPRLFQLRSLMALARGDHDLALTEAEAMVALDPNGDESHLGLGRMYFYTGQYERAIESLNAAERINPDGRASYSAHLAFSHLARGRTEIALSILETTAERKPDYSPTPAYLAIIYQLAGREAEARQQAALLVRNAPDTTLRVVEYLFMPMLDRSLARRFVEAGRRAGIPG